MKSILLTVFVLVMVSNLQQSYAGEVRVSNVDEFTNALTNKDYTTIFLSPGEYVGNFTIKRNNLTILAETPDTVKLKPLVKDKPVFHFNNTLGFSKMLTLRNLTFEAEDIGPYTTAIDIYSYKDITLDHIRFIGFRWPVTLSLIEGMSIINCNFQTFQDAISADYLSGSGAVRNCVFAANNKERSGALRIQKSSSSGILKINDNKFDTTFAVIVKEVSGSYEVRLGDNTYDTLTPFIYESDTANTESLERQLLDLQEEKWRNFSEDEAALVKSIINNEQIKQEVDARLIAAIKSTDYEERTTLLQRYLQSLSQEELTANIENFILAVKLLAIPLTWEEDIFTTHANRKDLLGQQLYLWPGLKYFLPACAIAVEGRSPDVFEMAKQNLSIEGQDAWQLVGSLPSMGVESFRTNITLYLLYREVSTSARNTALQKYNIMKNRDEAPIATVTALRNLVTSIENISALGDKEVRIFYYDLPLWIIMLQVSVAIDKADGDADKLEEVGANFASYGIIPSKGITGTSTSLAFDGLANRFKDEFGILGKKRFNKLKTALETIPPWWQDTGAALIEETKRK